MEQIYDGFVEMADGSGVKRVEIYKDSGIIRAYVDSAHSVDSASEFVASYGRKLFNDLQDYKKGNSIGVERVWV